jgi:ribonuclease P protein component
MEYARIKKNNEFQKIFSKGKRGYASRLTVVYSPEKGVKMGICVGKKHGNSVTRNRIKRLLREVFRKNLPALKDNYNYVLVPKAAEEYSYAVLEKEFLYIVKKQRLLKEPNEVCREQTASHP